MTDLRNLDLNLLIIFEAIYSSGNISHASKSLNVSRPTISNALTRLRDTLDDQLFVRAGQGIEPTPKAKQIIVPVREALQILQSGVGRTDEFHPDSTVRHFRIIMLDQLEAHLMPSVIKQIQDYKSVTLEALHIGNTSVIDGLMDDSVDLVLSIYVPEIDELNRQEIGKVDLAVIARKEHPKINGAVTLDQFKTLNHVGLPTRLRSLAKVDEELRHMGIERHFVYTISKFWSFPFIVENTDLIAMVPEDFARIAVKSFNIEMYPLPFKVTSQRLYMTWKKSRENDPGLKWLRERVLNAHEESN